MSDKKIDLDTGDPGFEVNGSQLTYDVGDPDAQPNPVPNTPKLKTVDTDPSFYSGGRRKDLSNKTLVTLSQYMSDLTTAKQGDSKRPNVYPVDRNTVANKVKTEIDGYPASLSNTTNSKTFTTGIDPTNQGSGLFPYSKSYPTIQQELKKGSVNNSRLIDGNELLKSTVESPDYAAEAGVPSTKNLSGPVKNYVSDVLKYNRFTADNKRYSDVATPQEYNYQLPSDSSGKNTLNSQENSYSLSQIKMIGPSLSLRSSGELGSLDSGLSPNSAASIASALVPGTEQFLTQINNQNLNALDALKNLSQEQEVKELNISNSTWGSLNNINDRFSGLNAAGMNVLSISLLTGVVVSIEVLVNILKPFVSSGVLKTDSSGKFFLGKSYTTTSPSIGSTILGSAVSVTSDINRFLGLTPTKSDFFECVNRGIAAIYGINTTDTNGLISSLISTVNPVDMNAATTGWKVVFSRSIIRSGAVVAEAISGIASQPGGFIGGVSNFLSILEKIRDSKVISAINVFAQIGDVIDENSPFYGRLVTTDVYGNRKVSTIDSLPNNIAAAAVTKSRLNNGNETLPKLAWAADRNINAYILPAPLIYASNGKLNRDDNDFVTLAAENNLSQKNLQSGRIPTEIARAIENQLEADYVPFYFHDIRTNEIVSFHAFLTSLSDGYSAGYDTVDAFGRVEPIKTYKGTTRKVGLSFMIVSTGSDDFEEMYKKINKLTTLVYPQFTKGKQLVYNEGNRFIQPFSQLVGASPLIRIRLGNLITSNYSRFNLARLFGLGDEGSLVLKNVDLTTGLDITTNDSRQTTVTSYKERVGICKAANCRFGILPLYFQVLANNNLTNIDYLNNVSLVNYAQCYVAEIQPSGVYKLSFVNQGDYETLSDDTIKKLDFLKNSYAGQLINERVTSDYHIIKDEFLLLQTNSCVNTLALKAPSVKDNATEFMNPVNNAFVKYFEESGGKGLAGYIESMDFDWYDRVTWEIGEANKAPKMCKVTIGFSPIHDITPGIDHQGYNRAPIYRIGAKSKGPQEWP